MQLKSFTHLFSTIYILQWLSVKSIILSHHWNCALCLTWVNKNVFLLCQFEFIVLSPRSAGLVHNMNPPLIRSTCSLGQSLWDPIPFIVSNVGISVHFLVYFPTCFSCSTVHLHIPPAIVYPEIKWYAPHHSECISIARIVCEHTYCPGGKWTCRFSGAPCNCFTWYKLAWQGYVRCSELEVCRCGIKINGMVRIGLRQRILNKWRLFCKLTFWWNCSETVVQALAVQAVPWLFPQY